MKLKKFLVVFFAIATLFVTSCDKENEVQSMSALVDGKEWSATALTLGAYSYSDYLTLFGVSADGSKILIVVRGKTEGTYDLKVLDGATKQVSFYVANKDDADDEKKRYVSTTGSVTLTSVGDNMISGNFHFTAVKKGLDPIKIENGVFNNVIYLSQ